MGNGVSLGCSDETLFSSSVQNLSLLFIFFHPSPECISHHKNVFQISAIIYSTFSVTSSQKWMSLLGPEGDERLAAAWGRSRLAHRQEQQQHLGSGPKSHGATQGQRHWREPVGLRAIRDF